MRDAARALRREDIGGDKGETCITRFLRSRSIGSVASSVSSIHHAIEFHFGMEPFPFKGIGLKSVRISSRT